MKRRWTKEEVKLLRKVASEEDWIGYFPSRTKYSIKRKAEQENILLKGKLENKKKKESK